MSYAKKKKETKDITVSVKINKDVWLLFRNTCWKESFYIKEAVEKAFMDFVEKMEGKDNVKANETLY